MGGLLLGALAQQVEQRPGADIDRFGDLRLGQLVLIFLYVLPGGFHLCQSKVPRFCCFWIHITRCSFVFILSLRSVGASQSRCTESTRGPGDTQRPFPGLSIHRS